MVTNEAVFGNVDLDQVKSWLQLLHGRSEGWLHVCSTASWRGQMFSPDELEGVGRYIQRLDQSGVKGIYLRVTTLNRLPRADEPEWRGSVTDSATLPGFWADIDIAGPGHKTSKPLPPDEDAARQIIIESRLPEPTLWVHSGGGLYPWWLFAEPIPLGGDPAIIDAIQDVSTRWQNVIVAAAERLGYSYGGVGDLSRVMRIPGTVNRKTDEPRPCRIVAQEGRLFTDDEISGYLENAEALVRELTPKPKVPVIPMPRTGGEPVGDRPGDALAARLSWEEILMPAGYQFDRLQGVESYWVRPGKDRRDGHSCTTNYGGSDLLYVFSTEMDGFEAGQTYTKFAAWAILNGYGWDFKSASKVLRAQGFGAQRPQSPGTPQPLQPRPLPEDRGAVVQEPAPLVIQAHYDNSDMGNAERLAAMFGNQFRWVGSQKEWYAWGGQVWRVDHTRQIDRAAKRVTEEILRQAKDLAEADEDHDDSTPAKLRKCQCSGCALRKWATSSRSDTRMKGMISRFGGEVGIAVGLDDFDTNKKLITVGNGVLNPETREMHDFDPRRMMTRQMGADYDPQATAPKFEAFLAQVLPDADMRDYVQRAMGYTLLGENDQRAIFMLHGPSGTGKSQFLNIMEGLFGGFGTTAAAATFRQTRNEATNDVHALRGKRFVTSSETSETAVMDEELIKRVTGRDNITSRDLYEKNSTWTPECAIWFATNFAPKLNSDDSAIWARFKPITFNQQFTREAGTEIPDLGKKILAEEASGILNWLLDGVAKYREHGLGEPGMVREAVVQQRLDSDNVAQFVASALEEGKLEERADMKIRRSLLFELYEAWCKQERLNPFGQRRFNNRVRALKPYGEVKDSVMCWSGVGLAPGAGLLGRMG